MAHDVADRRVTDYETTSGNGFLEGTCLAATCPSACFVIENGGSGWDGKLRIRHKHTEARLLVSAVPAAKRRKTEEITRQPVFVVSAGDNSKGASKATKKLLATPSFKQKWAMLPNVVEADSFQESGEHGELWGLALVRRGTDPDAPLDPHSSEFLVLCQDQRGDAYSCVVLECAKCVSEQTTLQSVSFDGARRQFQPVFEATEYTCERALRAQFVSMRNGRVAGHQQSGEAFLAQWGFDLGFRIKLVACALPRPLACLVSYNLWAEFVLPLSARRTRVFAGWPCREQARVECQVTFEHHGTHCKEPGQNLEKREQTNDLKLLRAPFDFD
eukprot:6491256-Amphidinium_carterae.4